MRLIIIDCPTLVKSSCPKIFEEVPNKIPTHLLRAHSPRRASALAMKVSQRKYTDDDLRELRKLLAPVASIFIFTEYSGDGVVTDFKFSLKLKEGCTLNNLPLGVMYHAHKIYSSEDGVETVYKDISKNKKELL